MAKHDIVYILKNNYTSDELTYSIRSVCKNFPYRKIWFYGGAPEGIMPDVLVEYQQSGNNKWEKVRGTLTAICRNDEITPDFWLFNDDFFVMKKVSKLQPMVYGTLSGRVRRIQKKRGGRNSTYSMQLNETARVLNAMGYDSLDYALHVPMLINREKALQTLAAFPDCPMFRSLYGNHHSIGGVITKDVKIQSESQMPTGEEIFLSTNDRSFRDGKVGRYIREAFPDRCRYEL